MQSSTADRFVSVPLASAPSGALGRGDVGTGLVLLQNLVGCVSVPRTLRQEALALAALEAVHRQHPLGEAEKRLADELLRAVRSLDEAGAYRIAERLARPRLFRRHRAAAHLLLFGMLVKIAAPQAQDRVWRSICGPGGFGTFQRLDVLLRSIRRHRWPSRSARLAASYLRLAADVLLTGEDARLDRPERVSLAEFVGWPWQRQLIQLLAWRSAAHGRCAAMAGAGVGNPIFLGGTTEFALAHERGFQRIVRRGGAVARSVLSDLGYRDRRVDKRDRAPRRRFLLALLLIAAGIGLAWLGRERIRRFDDRSRALAAQVLDMYDASSGDNAPAGTN